MNLFKTILIRKITISQNESRRYIGKLILEYFERKAKKIIILDVGCGNGEKLGIFLKNVNNFELYGIDILDECSNKLFKIYKKTNLDGNRFPFKDCSFDIVFSNQVIEHLLDKDRFILEINRVLKKGGMYIISTENISSLDNIVSLLLGQEPLVQNSSLKYHLGSFLSPHNLETIPNKPSKRLYHKNVCSYFSLLRLVKMNGFIKPKIKSFGNFIRFFELLLPFYNRILLIYGIKE